MLWMKVLTTHRMWIAAAIVLVLPLRGNAQSDWLTTGHDNQAQRYSPLKQIDVHNVAKLAPAWTFRLQDEGNAAGSRTIESVPLVVNGRMYVSWPFCHVAAHG
jgi:glucose dehydrogenase